MISEPQEFLELIEKHTDTNLGTYDREHVINELRYDMKRWIKDTLQDQQEKELFDAIDKHLGTFDPSVKENTGVELHYIVKGESAVQYISPYHKYYKVGKTLKEVNETSVWILRPDYVTLGNIVERKWQDEEDGRAVREETEHTFGKAKEVFNVFCLSTVEHQKIGDQEATWSTLHITFLIPIGEHLFNQICAIRKTRNDAIKEMLKKQAAMKEKLNKKKKVIRSNKKVKQKRNKMENRNAISKSEFTERFNKLIGGEVLGFSVRSSKHEKRASRKDN